MYPTSFTAISVVIAWAIITLVIVKLGSRSITDKTSNVATWGKDKITSVFLAVFMGFLTWLYTYKKDAWKFWVGLGIDLTYTIIWVLSMKVLYEPIDLLMEVVWALSFLIAFLLAVVYRIWAIVDVAIKSKEWYKTY